MEDIKSVEYSIEDIDNIAKALSNITVKASRENAGYINLIYAILEKPFSKIKEGEMITK